MKPAHRRVSWYGKLPARGDFVGRGFPARFRGEWDAWLQHGLAFAAASDKAALSDRLRSFAPWRYLASPSPGETWCGIMVPSHDRVGRAFPLTLAERTSDLAAPHAIAARLASLLGAAAEGPEALEAAIASLPELAQPQVRSAEAPPSQRSSLWWPLAAAPDAVPLRAAWPPQPEMLIGLLDPQSAAHQIASAE